MLKTRVITALVLVSIFLAALFYLPPLGWAVFATLVAVLAAWEWGGLMGYGKSPRLFCAAGVAVVASLLMALRPAAFALEAGFSETAASFALWFYVPAALFWLLAVPLWLRQRWRLPRGLAGLALGALIVFPTWLAMIQLRQLGAAAMLAIMATIWLADIAAYFSGRHFGRHKLAPNISPGKTWEGAIGAAIGVTLYGFLLLPVLPGALAEHKLLFGLSLLLLTAISISGDLFESMLKRQAGIKDSSGLLPGHGGVLDRIDSLTSTLPLVAFAWLSFLH